MAARDDREGSTEWSSPNPGSISEPAARRLGEVSTVLATRVTTERSNPVGALGLLRRPMRAANQRVQVVNTMASPPR
jgi:hypothetical protein